MPTKNKAVNTKLRGDVSHTVSLDYEEELSSSKKTSMPNKETPTKTTTKTTSLEKAEKICKLIATFIIILSATFHFYRLFRYEKGGQTCPLLFESGRWIQDKWQPDGCMIHEYEPLEVQTCLQHQEVAIIGDSRMRSIYFHLADTVSEEPVKSGKKHENLYYRDKKYNLTITFYWMPELDQESGTLFKSWIESGKIPHLIIMGLGTWTIKNSKHTAVVDYQEQLKSLSPSLNHIGRNLTLQKLFTIANSKTRFHHEPQFIWLMQDPVIEDRLSIERKAITNIQIELYNYAAKKSLDPSPFVHIMNATTLMAAGKPDHSNDGLHYDSFIIKNKLDAILNSFCNDFVYPDDASCCRDLDHVTQLQFNTFAMLSTCVILWFLMFICRKRRDKVVQSLSSSELERYDASSMFPWMHSEHMYTGIKAMAKLAFIILYIFLADSSLLYDKEHKTYSHAAFFVPLVIIFIVALLTRGSTKNV
eukprot:TCONS_00056781-protein